MRRYVEDGIDRADLGGKIGIPQVARDDLQRQSREIASIAAGPSQRPYVPALGDEQPGEIGSDEAGATRQKGGFQPVACSTLGRIGCASPPRIQSSKSV